MSRISMDKGYTFNGEDISLLTVDKPGEYPVVGYSKVSNVVYEFTADGTPLGYTGLRLIEDKPSVWVNIYEELDRYEGTYYYCGGDRATKEEADKLGGARRVACIEIKKGEYI